MREPNVLLIGGSSHAGKSTLGRRLAERLGWACVSTDYLARHPGRPWRAAPDEVPLHVAAYYSDLDLEAQMASVLAHYESLWPAIVRLVGEHAGEDAESGLVLEGSAILPAKATSLGGHVAAVWILAEDDLLERRIRQESGYDHAPSSSQALIDKFVARSLSFNRLVADQVQRLGLPHLMADDGMADDALERAARRFFMAWPP